jgi:hypothetical protein
VVAIVFVARLIRARDFDMQETSLLDDTEDFLGKWRARWPEWRIARTFVDPAFRDRAEAWFALLQEFVDAAWSGEDATPGIAKLSWWQDELRGWSKGARRHPLGAALQKIPAPWPALALSLATLQAARSAVRDTVDATTASPSIASTMDALNSCAGAIAACEAAIFVDSFADSSADASPIDSHAADADEPHGGARLIALYALWAFGHTPSRAQREFARQLLANWPGSAATRPSRVYGTLIRKRLGAIAAGRALSPLSPWATLWAAWRAARP